MKQGEMVPTLDHASTEPSTFDRVGLFSWAADADRSLYLLETHQVYLVGLEEVEELVEEPRVEQVPRHLQHRAPCRGD